MLDFKLSFVKLGKNYCFRLMGAAPLAAALIRVVAIFFWGLCRGARGGTVARKVSGTNSGQFPNIS